MLFVPNPRRFCRPHGPLAATPLLLLATAAAAFTAAAAQDPSGFEHLRAGRYDEAIQALRSQARDGNAAALSGWVTALRETGDYDGAVEAAEQGVERGVAGTRALLGGPGGNRARTRGQPADLEALGTRAAIPRLDGDDQGFRAAMETIRSVAPVPTASLLLLSELHSDHRKYEDALAFARDAAAADPESWDAWGLMGLNQVRLGRVEAGRENLEKAFAGDRFNLWFKNTLDLLDTFVDYRPTRPTSAV